LDILTDIILAGAVGGLLALDRTAVFQIMISRPIVSGPIIGLLLGQPAVGVVMGGLVELIWISRLPLGGYVPPNESVGAMVGTAAVILAGPGDGTLSRSMIVLGFLFVPPVARLAAYLEVRLRYYNVGLVRLAERAVEKNKPRRIPYINMAGLAFNFVVAFFYILSTVSLTTWLLGLVGPNLPPPVEAAFETMYLLIPLVAVTAALSNLNVKRAPLVFALVFGVIFIILSL
jgi:PTS system mannose-specific IIC component